MQRTQRLFLSLPSVYAARAAPPSALRFSSTAAAPASSSAPPPAEPTVEVQGSAALNSAAEAGDLSYYVPRTRFGELPVYSEIKNGGTRFLTVVRKAEGDVEALRRDLSAFLSHSVPLFVKPQTGQVVIRGEWVRETKEWLAAKGF
ncbi:hypothetical protein JCM10207_002998 [Rhodosporidiobolus poonsookiae]